MDEIRKLIDKLNYHTKLYDTGKPEISDKEWDDMYFELVKLEKQEQCYFEDSPTQKVNFQVVNELKKVEHSHPMLSLDKTKEISEVESFIGSKSWIAMAKMDGLTCSLTYENGYLIKAETRGNGIIGEDILHNVLQIKNVPNRIDYKDTLIVDGEVICTYKNFENFKDEYKNPRNFAAGSIRLLNSEESAMRKLSFVAWDIIEGFKDINTLSGKLVNLQQLNFTVVPLYVGANSIKDTIEMLKKQAEFYSYPIDGLVFKYDNIYQYQNAGRTDHHFKGGLAYKFYDEEYETTLIDIEWTMGRTGILTPVAIFEPIDIDGTEVSRASLHNISIMNELSDGWQHKGDTLYIYKANQIIPQVKKWEHKNNYCRDTQLDILKVCPICGEPTEIKQDNDSKMLYCTNLQCEGKLINKIEHFFGKKGLDAKGISKATIEKLINWGWVSRISDMFTLDAVKEEWEKIPGFGTKSVNNILGAIRKSQTCLLESVLSGAGIPLIGKTVAKDLSKYFKSYSRFRESIQNGFDFNQFKGFGAEMHKSISTFNYEELDYIVENYLNIQEIEEENGEQFLKDITFCITGKLKTFKNRDELKTDIENKGGKVVDSISNKVNYLINNDFESGSAKNVKAKSLGIKIITEEEYLKIS